MSELAKKKLICFHGNQTTRSSPVQVQANGLMARNPLQVTVFISKVGRDCRFTALNAVDNSEMCPEFLPVETTNLFVHPIRRRSEMVQAACGWNDGSTQTVSIYPRHANCQYEPRYLSAQDVEQHFQSPTFHSFVTMASLRIERVLVENELFNPFKDHISSLKSPPLSLLPSSIGSQPMKNGARCMMYHSDMCEGKFVSTMQCHPTISNLIVAGYCDKIPLEQRGIHNNIMRRRKHFALLWNSQQLMQPLLILEAADDLLDIHFNPKQPLLVAGSCHSGMIAVWDLWTHRSLLTNNPTTNNVNDQCPLLTPVAATLDYHPSTSRRLQWVPPGVEFSLKGPSSVSAVRPAVQLYASYEGHMIVWDFKLPERGNDDPSSPLPCLPSRIKSVFKLYPTVNEKRRDIAISAFAMTESGDDKPAKQGGITATVTNPFPPICIVGTTEGEILMVDWRAYADVERGAACPVNMCIAYHDGPVLDVLPSPLLPSTVLSIGGKMWAIWKPIDLESPVVDLPTRTSAITSASWSPWQPSVIAIGLASGIVEVWDMLSSLAVPKRQFRVSRTAISAIDFGRGRDGAYIAIADADGTGKVILLPFHVDNFQPDPQQIRKSESFIQEEATHRCSLAQLLRSSSPSLTEVKDDIENLETITTITKEQYWSDFVELEDKIVRDIESKSDDSHHYRLEDQNKFLNNKLSE